MSTHRGTCERCGAEGRLVGPFRDDAGREDDGEDAAGTVAREVRHWEALCGPCKVRVTMTLARIAAIRAAVKKVAADNGLDVQMAFWPEEKES